MWCLVTAISHMHLCGTSVYLPFPFYTYLHCLYLLIKGIDFSQPRMTLRVLGVTVNLMVAVCYLV